MNDPQPPAAQDDESADLAGLFDPAEHADDLVARVEQALLPLRWQPRELVPPRRPAGAPLLPWALAASLLVAAWLAVQGSAPPAATASYPLAVLAGAPQVRAADGRALAGDALASGQRLSCDDATRVRLLVESAGSVDIQPGSELMARHAEAGGWHLELLRGELSASIFAAPGRFRVGTPAGLAVDMGCVYTARVEEDGSTSLTVRGGAVSFRGAGRRLWVPAGATLTARPGERPGTPVWEDEDPRRVELVATVDGWALSPAPRRLAVAQRAALVEILAAPDARHTLTSWHLLDHPWSVVREAAFDAVAAVEPPPDGVTRADVLGPDPRARDAWREDLELHW